MNTKSKTTVTMMRASRIIAYCLELQICFAFHQPTTKRPFLYKARDTTKLKAFELVEPQMLMGALDSFYKNDPYAAAFLTCSIKASAADCVAQVNSSTEYSSSSSEPLAMEEEDEDKHSMTNNAVTAVHVGDFTADYIHQDGDLLSINDNFLDLRRNFAFLLYGGIYQGMAQQYLYSVLFPCWFPSQDAPTLLTVSKQVMLDQFVITPFICLPIAYIIKASVSEGDSLMEGLTKYFKDCKDKGLLLKYNMVWFPVQCLTFGVIPTHLRIVFVATVSFFWLILLSTISSSEEQELQPQPILIEDSSNNVAAN